MKTEFNLISYSDRFRRLPPEQRDLRDARLVQLTRDFAGFASQYDPRELDCDVPLRKMKEVVGKMAESLTVKGMDCIVLPVSEHFPGAAAIQERVLAGTNFVLQSRPYTSDLSAEGPIYAEVRTVLDEGYRGMCDIDEQLKYRWDNEMQLDRQIQLEFGD
jgi:hypothetical protein